MVVGIEERRTRLTLLAASAPTLLAGVDSIPVPPVPPVTPVVLPDEAILKIEIESERNVLGLVYI